MRNLLKYILNGVDPVTSIMLLIIAYAIIRAVNLLFVTILACISREFYMGKNIIYIKRNKKKKTKNKKHDDCEEG